MRLLKALAQPHRLRINWAVIVGLFMAWAGGPMPARATEPSADAEVVRLMEALRHRSAGDTEDPIVTLARLEQRAIPALVAGLRDESIQSECAEALTRIRADLAIPPLTLAIDQAPIVSSRDRLWKAKLIAALGKLRSTETVPYLEYLYSTEEDKTAYIARSIAWALQNVTGREYGPAYNPWVGCSVIVPAR